MSVVESALAENFVSVKSDDRAIHRETKVDVAARNAAATRDVLAAIFGALRRLLPLKKSDRHEKHDRKVGRLKDSTTRLHLSPQKISDFALRVSNAGNAVGSEHEAALEWLTGTGRAVVWDGHVHVYHDGSFAMSDCVVMGSAIFSRTGGSAVVSDPDLVESCEEVRTGRSDADGSGEIDGEICDVARKKQLSVDVKKASHFGEIFFLNFLVENY